MQHQQYHILKPCIEPHHLCHLQYSQLPMLSEVPRNLSCQDCSKYEIEVNKFGENFQGTDHWKFSQIVIRIVSLLVYVHFDNVVYIVLHLPQFSILKLNFLLLVLILLSLVNAKGNWKTSSYTQLRFLYHRKINSKSN